MAVIDWWNGPLTLVVIFFALCLLLTWSIACVACRACHSSGTFFSLWHTHTHTHTHTHAHTHTHTHDGAGGWVSEEFVSTDARLASLVVQSEARWARISEVQVRIPSRGMDSFFPHAVSSIFRLSLTRFVLLRGSGGLCICLTSRSCR